MRLCAPGGWRVLVAEYGLCRGLAAVVSHSLRAMAVAHAAAEEPRCPQPCTAGCLCAAPFSPQAGKLVLQQEAAGLKKV